MAIGHGSQRQQERIAAVQAEMLANPAPAEVDPAVERLVTEIIGRVADKWTMLVLEILTEHGELRFTRIAEYLEGISQKMLTKTLRQMERDGLLQRTVHPVVPPRVEYQLTELGYSLGAAFCGVWIWAEKNHEAVIRAREQFDAVPTPGVPQPRVAV
ncbi:MAG: ArsR family transcriptional regulator [Acidobacteriaceae bacterium]|nr:ArsR family transcriptional regulator [Acidobacteriaceae bacterium]